MIKNALHYIIFISIVTITFSSCGSSKGNANLYDPKEVAMLSRQLEIALDNKDKDDDRNIPLYAEVSTWLGTPYRYGGTTKRGVDCSGFTMQVYRKVYKTNLPRSTSGLAKAKYKKVSKSKLTTGDLILFATGKSKKQVSHVGIYMKDGKFIHASTSKGVMVNHIDENYYKKTWVRAIRVK